MQARGLHQMLLLYSAVIFNRVCLNRVCLNRACLTKLKMEYYAMTSDKDALCAWCLHSCTWWCPKLQPYSWMFEHYSIH